MSNSVILQVDESTKGLMEEIQSGISSSIEDGMREVKDKVESVDDTTDMILRKFKNFDGLSSSIEQLRSLAEESKKFTTIVSPLENSVSELRQRNRYQAQILSQVASDVELLVKGIKELGDKEGDFASDIKEKIQIVLNSVEDVNENTSELLKDILQKLSQAENERQVFSGKISSTLASTTESIVELSKQLEDNSEKLGNHINELTSSHISFSKTYVENESVHNAFERQTSSQIDDINKSIEKIQTTLDIIVNLVTPFWKKW